MRYQKVENFQSNGKKSKFEHFWILCSTLCTSLDNNFGTSVFIKVWEQLFFSSWREENQAIADLGAWHWLIRCDGIRKARVAVDCIASKWCCTSLTTKLEPKLIRLDIARLTSKRILWIVCYTKASSIHRNSDFHVCCWCGTW